MRFKAVANPKTERLVIRVTREEKAEIEAKARDCLLPVSEFVLKTVLAKRTRTQHDLHLMNQMRQIGLQIKEIYAAEKPREAKELEPVLTEIVKSIALVAAESRFKL